MVRGSGVDDAARPAGSPTAQSRMPTAHQAAGRAIPPGPLVDDGGGRWLVWTLRAVLWIVLLIIGYRGITAIIFNETPASRSGSSAPASGGTGTSQFPVTLAEAYALQFGAVYLNFSTATAGQRSQELAAYVPGALISADPQLGWDGSGSLQLDSEQVAGITVQDATHAVVTLLASVNNGQLMQLGVPIYAANGGLVVSGEPAWLAAPPQAAPPSPPAAASESGRDRRAERPAAGLLPGLRERRQRHAEPVPRARRDGVRPGRCPHLHGHLEFVRADGRRDPGHHRHRRLAAGRVGRERPRQAGDDV